eukprot:TRINITY_DN227_c0_g1_i4.p1 TRINITY_DN227_c0_g1~~TRINITY_DN227_c0_g1_i4.p1  ORF type:complete len:294 (+),score=39.46 TRINITY_DN227_c0_g1_i4:49-930(+)
MSFYDYNAAQTSAPQENRPYEAEPVARPFEMDARPSAAPADQYYDRPASSQDAPRPRLDAQQLEEIDARSVFVGNVEFASTNEQLKAHFQGCGEINRVTIVHDRATGRPRGYAFIEFATKEGAAKALDYNESMFFERSIKVVSKRTSLNELGGTRRARPPRRSGPYGGPSYSAGPSYGGAPYGGASYGAGPRGRGGYGAGPSYGAAGYGAGAQGYGNYGAGAQGYGSYGASAQGYGGYAAGSGYTQGYGAPAAGTPYGAGYGAQYTAQYPAAGPVYPSRGGAAPRAARQYAPY